MAHSASRLVGMGRYLRHRPRAGGGGNRQTQRAAGCLGLWWRGSGGNALENHCEFHLRLDEGRANEAERDGTPDARAWLETGLRLHTPAESRHLGNTRRQRLLTLVDA